MYSDSVRVSPDETKPTLRGTWNSPWCLQPDRNSRPEFAKILPVFFFKGVTSQLFSGCVCSITQAGVLSCEIFRLWNFPGGIYTWAVPKHHEASHEPRDTMGRHAKAASNGKIFPLKFLVHGICCLMGMAVPYHLKGRVAKAWDESPGPSMSFTPSQHVMEGQTFIATSKNAVRFRPDEWFTCYQQLLKIGWRLQRKGGNIFHGK